MDQVEWSDLRFFLELARTGSPAAAARRLKADHTTVRRRISALESTLKTRLISTRGSIYELTPEGDRLLRYSEAIEALAARAQDEVANKNSEVSGVVRLGTLDGFGAYYLAPRLARLGVENPQLQIQMIILPRVANLSNREADLAISLSPPNQLRQIVRKLTNFRMGIYASEAYLSMCPPITTLEDLAGHRFVGYIPDMLHEAELDNVPRLNATATAMFESTSIIAQIEATVAGAGLCVLPDFIAFGDARLRPVLKDTFSLERQYWLVIHPEMVNLARVRTVIDFICESVRTDHKLFSNSEPQPED